MIRLFNLIMTKAEAWLNDPVLLPRHDPDADDSGFVLTGESTIKLIVESVRQNQSVVLSGPRGCGKSYCVRQAIKRAAREGLILPGAKVELQGNREFPRDYLMEDSLVLRTSNGKVVPEMVSAPLFKFARRSAADNKPVTQGDEKVVMSTLKDTKNQDQPVQRFVLFLDEVNRFSDGVLDSLLSVLEERQAILAGDTYRLPVVVLMTMNPPGYDGTARRLSPPLQARIGRNWRLYSPDLRTQTSLLIPERRKKILESILDVEVASRSANRKDYVAQELGKTAVDDAKAQVVAKVPPGTPDKLLQTLQDAACEEAMLAQWQIEGRDGVPTDLCRRAAMVCVCLWGLPRVDETAHMYLTKGTRAMLSKLARENHLLRDAMTDLLELCTYGPDGRAAPDWVQAAYSLARRDDQTAKVQKQHFRATLIDTLSHKLNDSFSSANEPDKERKKHQAILRIFDEIFLHSGHRVLNSYLSPLLENDLWIGTNRNTLWPMPCPDESKVIATLRRIFEEAGLVDHEEHVRWMGDNPGTVGGVVADIVNKHTLSVEEILLDHDILVAQDSLGKLAFSSEGWKKFFELLSTKASVFHTPMRQKLCAIGVAEVRPTIEKEVMESYPVLRLYGSSECFKNYLNDSGGMDVDWRKDPRRREHELLLAKALTLVWEKASDTSRTVLEKGDETSQVNWEESLHDELGLLPAVPPPPAGLPAHQMKPIHPQFLLLLKKQHQFAEDLANQAFYYKFFNPARWLGRPFKPAKAQWLPGDVKANLYRDGIARLIKRF